MSKKIVFIALLITLTILGGTVYLLTNKSKTEQAMETSGVGIVTAPDQENNQVVSQAPSSASPGVYVNYSEAELAKQTDKTRLLFFHAPWCPQCQSLDKDINTKGAPQGTAIIKVDYDSNQDLRKKYGVTIQTTVVRIDDKGSLVEKYVAYDEPNVESIKANLL